jgi:hypothetical protein
MKKIATHSKLAVVLCLMPFFYFPLVVGKNHIRFPREKRPKLCRKSSFKKVVKCGLLFKSVSFIRNIASVDFTETALKLKNSEGQTLHGYEVAGPDQKFQSAFAVINPDGKCVRVWSDKVVQPVPVRYAWENYPVNAGAQSSRL